MRRYLESAIQKDLEEKIVLLSGPRQAGKTTLARQLVPESSVYLNYDSAGDRKILKNESWPRDRKLLILDEIHKMRGWKSWLKGIYDKEGVRPRLLVTGSARMDTYRRGGESLAGRHFLFRLHPFSPAELKGQMPPEECLDRILLTGAFPEPFLKGEEQAARRWRRGHLDRILREDLLDLEKVREIRLIELLVDALAERVGSPVSYRSLAEDLQVSPHTIKRWIEILESLFVVFRVTPYSRNIPRSLLKEPKIYFFDTGRVTSRDARLENAVACALLKRQQFLEDTRGEKRDLHYVRDRQKREVDFLTVTDQVPEWLIEVKNSDHAVSKSLFHFASVLQTAAPIQLVKVLRQELQQENVKVLHLAQWLAKLEA